jgi:hypothetical protein
MKRLFSLLALMLSVSIGFADTVTFDYANYLSKLDSRGGTYGNTSTNIGDISVTVTSSGSGSVSQNNGATLKFQVNTSFTISGGNISKVTITQSESNRTFTPSVGTISGTGTTRTWQGTATSVTFVNKDSTRNVNISSIVVEYTPTSSDATPFYNTDTWGTSDTQLANSSEWKLFDASSSSTYYYYNGSFSTSERTFTGIDALKNANLAFILPTNSWMGIDVGLHHLFFNGSAAAPSIVVKNLKAGEKVSITATGSSTITGTNTTQSSMTTTASYADYIFTANQAGSITLTFSGTIWINRIKTGTIPVVTNTLPASGATGVSASLSTLDITFDQPVTPVVGKKIYATAVGGKDEIMAGAIAYETGSSSIYMDTSDSKVLHLKVDASMLKTDVTYQVFIPSGAVQNATGVGNEAFSYKFTIAKGTSSATITYPYTWDFGKLSENLLTALSKNAQLDSKNTSRQWIANVMPSGSTTAADQTTWDGTGTVVSYKNYIITNSTTFTYQGKDLTGVYNGASTVGVNEFNGLRISLNKATVSTRLQLNVQNNSKSLTFSGNTHFITVPNLKSGAKLYIRARITNDGLMSVNSGNANYSQNGSGSIANASTTPTVYTLDVTSAGDVTLALANVTFYQIAVAAASKTFSTTFEGYATDCQPYNLRYDLTNTLGGTPVSAYIISAVDAARTVATPTSVASSPQNTGTILKATLSGTNLTLPLFVNDVNTATDNVSANKLVGVLTDTPIGSTATDGNYIFTNIYYRLDADDKTKIDESQKSTVAMGFYNTVAGTIAANKSYLHLGAAASSSAKTYLLFSVNTETTGIESIAADSNQINEALPASYYNLQGMKVDTPVKGGIYIYKGRKIVVR